MNLLWAMENIVKEDDKLVIYDSHIKRFVLMILTTKVEEQMPIARSVQLQRLFEKGWVLLLSPKKD